MSERVATSVWAERSIVAQRPWDPGVFVALAPMDGITDAVYRELMTSLFDGQSGISLCVSEFVRVSRARVVPSVLLRHCPELRTSGCTTAGVPVFVQLLGGEPGPMAETAALAADMGAPGIDLNFGCPAKTVNQSDGGAILLKEPKRVEAVTAAVREATPSSIPVTVKIRLGWDSAESIEALARAAERGGAAWLTIHGRTRTQLYRPPVDWSAIGRARAAIGIPVVANGDLYRPEDLRRCAQASGCRAFMIGRGAMARPALFRRIRGADLPELDLSWFCQLLLMYLEQMERVEIPHRTQVGRIKQWLRYGGAAFPPIEGLFHGLKRETDRIRLSDALQRVAERGEACCQQEPHAESCLGFGFSPESRVG